MKRLNAHYYQVYALLRFLSSATVSRKTVAQIWEGLDPPNIIETPQALLEGILYIYTYTNNISLTFFYRYLYTI